MGFSPSSGSNLLFAFSVEATARRGNYAFFDFETLQTNPVLTPLGGASVYTALTQKTFPRLQGKVAEGRKERIKPQ